MDEVQASRFSKIWESFYLGGFFRGMLAGNFLVLIISTALWVTRFGFSHFWLGFMPLFLPEIWIIGGLSGVIGYLLTQKLMGAYLGGALLAAGYFLVITL